VGEVSHVRHAPFVHKFSYRLWMLSVDLDRMEAGSDMLRHNRAGIVSFHDRDHGPRDGTPLRPWVEARLAAGGLARFGASIRFMAIPRIFGYAFNPIAFYFCHDRDGHLGAVLHQVKNTFGDQTSYLMAVEGPSTAHASMPKRMHVSPFFDLAGGYRFAVSAPDFACEAGDFTIAIRYGTPEAARMTAAMKLGTEKLETGRLLRLLAAMPLMPIRVFAAIHFHAVLLWLRGARFHSVPAALPASDLGEIA
jgi:DUF1365 family protein